MASAERKETYPVSLEKFFEALKGFAHYPEFVTGMQKADVKEQNDSSAKVAFEVEMMKKLAYSLNLRYSINEAKTQAELYWTLDSSPFFKVNNGSWKLLAKGPASVEASYRLELEFNFPVPGLILKGLVAKALPQAMNEFFVRAKTL